MDPVTAAIVAALAAGVIKGAGQLGEKALVDAYGGLRGLLWRKFGEQSGVAKAIENLEDRPDSAPRAGVLQEAVADTKAGDDPEIRAASEALLEQVRKRPGGEQLIQQAIGSYIAQASGGSSAQVHINQPDQKGSERPSGQDS